MTDKEKIRAEIERLYNQSLEDENRQADRGLECAANVSYGKSNACKELLSFIDSMQEEPVSADLEQAIDTYLATYFGGEKEKQDWPFLKKMAIHFANWQKEQDIKYGYITALQGEKRFARYILEMIANGWHIEAIKTACNDKIKEDEQ